MNNQCWAYVRKNIIGQEAVIHTYFGPRKVTYADYTASGRGITFIEEYIQALLRLYGNTHTEDDTTGIVTTERLHQAEKIIKNLVNAGDNYKLIAVGSGTTAAVHRLSKYWGSTFRPQPRITSKN